MDRKEIVEKIKTLTDERDSLKYLARGLRYDHQEDAKFELLTKAGYIQSEIDHLNKELNGISHD